MSDPITPSDSRSPSPASEDQKQFYLERDAFLSGANPMLGELARRYPYMFRPPHSGLNMLAGWYPVFEQLCHEIDAQLGEHKRGFHWDQLKAHEGAARWY